MYLKPSGTIAYQAQTKRFDMTKKKSTKDIPMGDFDFKWCPSTERRVNDLISGFPDVGSSQTTGEDKAATAASVLVNHLFKGCNCAEDSRAVIERMMNVTKDAHSRNEISQIGLHLALGKNSSALLDLVCEAAEAADQAARAAGVDEGDVLVHIFSDGPHDQDQGPTTH